MPLRCSALALLAAAAVAAGCGSSAEEAPSLGPGSQGSSELSVIVPDPPLGKLDGRPAGPRSGKVRWKRELEGPAVPGPAIGADGTVFAASNAGIMHALDGRTGKERWSHDGEGGYGIDLSTTSAVLEDQGLLLWPGPQDKLIALDTKTGEERWSVQFGSQPLTPLVDGDRVYVQDRAGKLTALRLRDGQAPERLWATGLGASSYSSPAAGEDGTVYTGADNDLIAVDPEGEERWRVKTRNLVEVSPAVAADGTVTVGSNDHHQYGVSPDGEVRWRYDLGDLTYSSATVTPDNLIYVGDHRGLVTALDASTGKARYRVLGKARTAKISSVGVWTKPVVDRDHAVYFGTILGHVHGFDGRGQRLLDVELGGTVDSYPALTPDGTLIVGSDTGTLAAIG